MYLRINFCTIFLAPFGIIWTLILIHSLFNEAYAGGLSIFGDFNNGYLMNWDTELFGSFENTKLSEISSLFYPQRIGYKNARPRRHAMDPKTNKTKIIPADYQKYEPPPKDETGKPVNVSFTVLIFQVRDIKEIDQEITLELRLQVYWSDPRLDECWQKAFFENDPKLSFKPLPLKTLEHIWFPDIFIDFVKKVEQPKLMETVPASIRYYKKDKKIRYSGRITITMSCPMWFAYYPADTQECNIVLKSYAYTNEFLNLIWHPEGPLHLVDKSVNSPNFEINLDVPKPVFQKTSSGHSYTGIKFTVLLKRKISYHLIQTFVPSTLFVMVSWLSFLVPPESVPGRMAICMTTLLTLTAMFSAVRQNIPKVSYIKALDIWMVACAFFVFLSLVEYTIVLKCKNKIPPKPVTPNSSDRKSSRVLDPNVGLRHGGDSPGFQIRKGSGENNKVDDDDMPDDLGEENAKPNKYAVIVKQIEKYTWMVVVVLFIFFNLIYWPWLIYSSDYTKDHDKTQYYS